jgi:hypothetical protein
MKNYVVAVSRNHMLSIFAGNTVDELPYRFQPKVQFILSFGEYSAFCRMAADAGIPCLCFKGSLHTKAFDTGNTNLLRRLFYMDISRAALAEVMMAIGAGRESTIITHLFEENCISRSIKLQDASLEYDKLPEDVKTKALNSIQSEFLPGIQFTQLSEHNMTVLSYALYLRSLSFMSEPEVLNLVE